MSIEVAIWRLLKDAAPVAALVGTRIYPLVLPPDPTYPAITYQTITGASEYSMQGSSELSGPRMQVDLYAETTTALWALKAAVMNALSGYSGDVGSPPVRIYGAFREMEIDHYENDLESSGPRVWRKSLDFSLWFKETY